MSSRYILPVLIGLLVFILMLAYKALRKKFFDSLDDPIVTRRTRKALQMATSDEILEEVDTQIVRVEKVFEKLAARGDPETGAEMLEETRNELQALRSYREQLIHEARERGLDIPD